MPLGAMGWALAASSGVGALGSFFGANTQASAATQAAQTQARAALTAAQMQRDMYDTTRTGLQPFINTADTAIQNLYGQLGPISTALPYTFSPSDLEKTPGYQFTKEQGEQAVQNGFAAQGLGKSGAALKGAANFVTGLASTTFNQQLQNFLAQQQLGLQQNQQRYNILLGPAQLAETAAAGAGSLGAQFGQQIGSNITNAGTAQAAGTNAAGGSMANFFGSLAPSLTSSLLAYPSIQTQWNALQAQKGSPQFNPATGSPNAMAGGSP